MGFRLFFIGIFISALLGAGGYIFKLQKDNTILKANAIKMESAIADQKSLIENQKKDFQEILDANNKMNELVGLLKKDLEDLDKRFNKGKRDVGKIAVEKPNLVSPWHSFCVRVVHHSDCRGRKPWFRDRSTSILPCAPPIGYATGNAERPRSPTRL